MSLRIDDFVTPPDANVPPGPMPTSLHGDMSPVKGDDLLVTGFAEHPRGKPGKTIILIRRP